ncbi:MAG: hypothetical protein WD317_06570 [Balneolaceae bacterium]
MDLKPEHGSSNRQFSSMKLNAWLPECVHRGNGMKSRGRRGNEAATVGRCYWIPEAIHPASARMTRMTGGLAKLTVNPGLDFRGTMIRLSSGL